MVIESNGLTNKAEEEVKGSTTKPMKRNKEEDHDSFFSISKPKSSFVAKSTPSIKTP